MNFEIVDSMVGRLNFAMIEMVRIPFAPQTIIVTPILLFLSVKLEKWITINLKNKPKRPWKAQKAGLVFTSFYMMSMVLIGLPVFFYFYYSHTFPKDCSIQVICLFRYCGDDYYAFI